MAAKAGIVAGMKLDLTCHLDTPSSVVRGVRVTLSDGELLFEIEGADRLHLPDPVRPRRTDGLWQTTCFELFVKPVGGEAYREFNFSPSTAWAAYAFDGYRGGMRNLPLGAAPVIARTGDAWRVTLPSEASDSGPSVNAISAVIEETGGTISYWALRHPAGKPDFHHPDCFALALPAQP